MKIPWPTVFVLFVASLFACGLMNTVAQNNAVATVLATSAATSAPTRLATETHTPTAAPTATDAFVAMATSNAATSAAAAAIVRDTESARAARESADNATAAATWTLGAVHDADALRNAEIESVELSNAETALALTAAPAGMTAAAPATWRAMAAADHAASIESTARQGAADRSEMVQWTGAGALSLSFVIVAIGLGAILGAQANAIEGKAKAEMVRATGSADAERARAEPRTIPVNPTGPAPGALADPDQWDRRLLAFVKQSILLSDGAGPAAVVVTPANNDGWNSRAEWVACVAEMSRRGWVVKTPGAGGGTLLTGGRTMGDLEILLTRSISPHPAEAVTAPL